MIRIFRSAIVISLFLLPVIFFLQDTYALEVGGQNVVITFTEAFVSRYIWRGQDLLADNDPAWQPSIDVSVPNFLSKCDLSFNVWGSFPQNAGHENAEELDYSFTIARDINEKFNLSTGYVYFDFPNTSSTVDVQEPWASFTLNKIPYLPIDVSANVFLGYDFQAKSRGPDEGWYYSWGFTTEAPLPKFAFTQDGQAIYLAITNWGNDGVADLKPDSLYATELSLSTTYALKEFFLTPSFNYTINHNDAINNGNEEAYCGIEFSYTF